MIVQQPDVKGGIAAVMSGYYGSRLEEDFDIRYVESYCDKGFVRMVLKAFKAYVRFFFLIRSFKPQLIHMHTSFGGSFYRMQPFLYMAKKRGIPVVDHLHGADFESFYVNASDKKKAKIRKVYGLCSKMIVLSDEWKANMLQVYDSDRIEVVENYCKPQDEGKIEALMEKRFAGKQVLFLGELGKRKGGYDFAKIAEGVLGKDKDVRFVFCGSGSEADEKAIKDSVALAAKDRAVFPGWVRGKDKEKLLEESAVFLLPSYNEGLPMSVLDAMAYGLPVVSTTVGGIPQIVRNGENGYVNKPGDCAAMADSINRILAERAGYIDMSKKSLAIAKGSYSFDVHVKKIEEIYGSVIGEN